MRFTPFILAVGFMVAGAALTLQSQTPPPPTTSKGRKAKAGDAPLKQWNPDAKKDADKRVPWTTGKLTGTPTAPPPYQTERAFPKLKFDQPPTMIRTPIGNRLLVAELGGKIFTFPEKDDVEKPDLLMDIHPLAGHWRTYGMVFHPDFPKKPYLYVCYVKRAGDPTGSIISRFTVKDTNPPTADIASEQIIFQWPSGGHNGCALDFGTDGYLYFSTGDGSDPSPPDRFNTAQNLGDYRSKIIRIDVNHEENGKKYAVPKDNPFVNLPDAKPEIWAYGFRNPWKMTIDPKTNDLWVGDVGWEMWEMVYRVEKGANYGWSIMEGPQPVKTEGKRGPTPILPPTLAHDHTESRSISGGHVYHGTRLKELTGAYIYGDYVTGKIWGLKHDGTKVTWKQELADSPLEIVDFGKGHDNEIYALDHGGTIGRIIPNPSAQANPNFPRKLSETGLFSSTKDHLPAPGVVRYAVNAEPWADHATSEHLFAVPEKGTLGVHTFSNVQQGIVKDEWIFPNDTVIARTMTIETERGNPASKRRVETQVLHRDRGNWRAYNFIWNDDQTDADLAGLEGSDRTFTVKDSHAPGGKTQQAWHHGGRTECLVCHTTRAGSILGFTQGQLNRNGPAGAEDANDNQLLYLDRLGFFEKPLQKPLPKLPDPFDSKEKLEDRARAYLHANCAACHRRGGGGTAAFELMYNLTLKRTDMVGSRPTQGTFGIHAPENIAAGDPYRSTIYYRMAKLGSGRMPYSGSGEVDERGLALLHDWISQLPKEGEAKNRAPSVSNEQRTALETLSAATDPAARAAAIEKLLSTTSGALFLLHGIDVGRIASPAREETFAAARKHTEANVRDLFERFVPAEERVKRLGNVIKPATLLAMTGDPAKGKEMYFKNSSLSCRNCHRIGTEGQEIGPDLTQIGKKYDRALILESILEPSKKIDPQYVTQTLETVSGIVHTGLLVKRTDKEVVLKDAQGKLITVKADDVEKLVPSQKSLMPEQLVKDMTAQELADLLAFLASLK